VKQAELLSPVHGEGAEQSGDDYCRLQVNVEEAQKEDVKEVAVAVAELVLFALQKVVQFALLEDYLLI
jgi:hypothetical protein